MVSGSADSPARDQPPDDYDKRNHNERVNQRSADVEREEPQRPQYEKDYGYCPEHTLPAFQHSELICCLRANPGGAPGLPVSKVLIHECNARG